MQKLCEYIYKSRALSRAGKEKLDNFAEKENLKELIDFIKKEKMISENELLSSLSRYFKLKLFKNSEFELQQNSSPAFELNQVEKFKMIILNQNQEKIFLGSIYPPDPFLKEKLRFKFKKKLEFYLMTEAEFKKVKSTLYSNYFAVDQKEILKDLPDFKKIDSRDIDSLKSIVEDAPVVKLLNKILTEAISLNASDIHLEKKEESFKVRYRIDGILKTYYNLPVNIAAAVISRIKIISSMDITIRHLPQDGKMEFKFQDADYDIRTSVIPTIYGEKAVLRLLLRSEKLLSVEQLNFSDYNLKRFKDLLQFNSGIILLSGPTGSGKTTTLFSILNQLASEENNIITIENPVEYKLKLLNQIEINQAQGLNFSTVLRSILRQDPDIIMIGEIRDQKTAEIAVRAAVTGHLVLSTIHTIDSISAVNRLLDMGIAPYLISSTLNAVVAQRLLRKLCPDCKEKKKTALEFKNIVLDDQLDYSYSAGGCSECHGSGYKGRTAAAEILLINQEMRSLINQNADHQKLQKAALDSGMKTLYQSGMEKIKNAESSLEELMRVIDLSHLI